MAFVPGLPGQAGTRRNTHPLIQILIIGQPLNHQCFWIFMASCQSKLLVGFLVAIPVKFIGFSALVACFVEVSVNCCLRYHARDVKQDLIIDLIQDH